MSPRQIRVAVAAAGLAAVLAGVLLGFIPATLPSGVGCGAPWNPDDTAAGLRDAFGLGVGPGGYTAECATALHGRGVAAVVVAVFGAVMLLAVVLMAATRPSPPPAVREG